MVITYNMKDVPYEFKVMNFDVSVETVGAGQLANCAPGEIRVNVEVPVKEKENLKGLYAFAADQHTQTKDGNGVGAIQVFEGREGGKVGESIQTVEFEDAWLADIDSSFSVHDEKLNLSFTVVATKMTISGVEFMHPRRKELI